MGFKELFKSRDGVSQVVGTTLMVAVTVILAAAVMSSVTSMNKPASSFSDVTIGITANSTATSTAPASIKLEHLDGDQIDFGDSTKTRVTASLNGADSIIINATSLRILSVGDTKILSLTSDGTTNAFRTGPVSGDTVIIKIIDLKTNQILISSEVEF